MSTERDELAGIIEREYVRAIHRKRPSDCYDAPADAIVAAGYRKQRTITTAEELDALPVGSIIRDQIGLALQYRYDGCWWCTNGDIGLTGEDIAHEGLPATVLWEPTS